MAIDYLTLKSLVDYLEGTIKELADMDVTRDKIEQDTKFAAAVKYFIQTAVETCSNITEHIIFGLNLGHPETTKGLFPILYKEKIIEQDLAGKLSNAVGLRNILVHQYRDVDLDILSDSSTIGLNDLREFAKTINDFLEKQKETTPKP